MSFDSFYTIWWKIGELLSGRIQKISQPFEQRIGAPNPRGNRKNQNCSLPILSLDGFNGLDQL